MDFEEDSHGILQADTGTARGPRPYTAPDCSNPPYYPAPIFSVRTRLPRYSHRPSDSSCQAVSDNHRLYPWSYRQSRTTKLVLPLLISHCKNSFSHGRTSKMQKFPAAIRIISSLTAGNLLYLNMNLQNRVNRQPVTILDLFKRSVVG